MAGSQKEFELLFKLKASLGGGFNSTFKNAIDTNTKLQNSLKNVNSLQSKIDGFTKQSAAIDKNKEKLVSLNAEHDRLQQELQQTGEPTEALRKKLEKNENQIQQTTAKIEEQTSKLNSYEQELKEAGIKTDNLENSNAKLQKSYDKLKTSQETVQKLNAKQQELQASIATTKTQLLGTVGTFAAIATAIYAGPVKSAMAFESNMAEVAKVVDWLKDGTGAVTQEYKDLEKQILSLSGKIPMTAEEITQIMAAAGQSNVASNNDELVKFTEDAAKMGIAFDVSAEQAGDWMAKWRTSFKMSQTEVVTLADQVNYLGNTSAANAAQISSIVTKIGPLGEVAGLSSGQIAAMGASLVAVGVSEDVAATGIKKVMTVMTAGSAATDRQAKVLKSVGMSATDMAKRMQTDAQGAILDFLAAVKKLPEAEQAAALKNYFGEEAVSAIAPLLTNLPYLEEQFNKVGDAAQYAGSMQGEYASRADTTENKVQLAKNSLKALSTTIGNVLLPAIGPIADKLSNVITKMAEFVQNNPKVVQTVLKVVAGLAALKVGMLTTKLFAASAESGIISLAMKLLNLNGGLTENAATSVGFATKMKTAGGGILSYFKNIKGALGGVGSALGNIFSGNALIGKVSGMLGGVKSTIITSISGLAGKAAGALTGAGSQVLGFILKPFASIGGRLGGLLSGVGGIIARSPLGTIGKVIGGSFSKITSLIAPLGNTIKTVLGPLGKLGSTILGPLGGIAGKVLPVVGVITTIITVIKMVKTHLQEIRAFIKKTFGDEALAVFDKVVSVITNIGNTIKGVFSDGNIGAARDKIQGIFGDKGVAVFDTFVNVLGTVKNVIGDVIAFITEHVVPVAEDIFNVIVTQIVPGIIRFIQAAAPTVMAIIQNIVNFIGAIIPIIAGFIAGLMPVIQEIIGFISMNVLPIIAQVFGFITGTVLPAISTGIQAILPVITSVLSVLLPAIQTAASTIWNVVSPIIQGILSAIQFVMPTILSIVQTVIQTVTGYVQGLMKTLGGIITFITGVFSGNWSQAWEGIKTIFSGVWESIKSVCTGVINGIVSAVNGVIRGLNKLKIPDWVPLIGGEGVNIPEIPMFAKGSKNTPDTFIAGEKGPELITNAAGRTVFTANQTKGILQSQNAAATTAATVKNVPTVSNTTNPQTVNNYGEAPEVTSSAGSVGGSNKNITINNNPTIVVNGNVPDDLDAKLEANNKKLKQDIEDMMEEKEDKERRQKYD